MNVRSRTERMRRAAAVLLGAAALALGGTACGQEDGGTAGSPAGDAATDSAGTAEPTESAGSPGADGSGEPAEEDGPGDGDGRATGGGSGEDERPWVFSYYGEVNNAEIEPVHLVLSEFSTIRDITWENWDADSATGTGSVSGMWCLPECTENPYPGEVTLSDPEPMVNGDGEQMFTTFRLEVELPEDDPALAQHEDLAAEHALGTIGADEVERWRIGGEEVPAPVTP
ncbi:hypothetical protein [Streptomyces sp. YIM 98790]|uniref:hypothetical protein n=1 Tax=Streptomyces sp. YIM 98790 TaxID=2689077 RepID=UPI00140A4F43|nr:hypothetical protein [Streptomyces sp. YIM 98790]